MPDPSVHESRLRAAQDVRLRAVTLADADELAALYRAQRTFLAPFEPIRPASFFTAEGQLASIAQAIRLDEEDRGRRFAILAGSEIVGTIAVSNIVRGAFQNATIGYFVGREWNGRGIATRAVHLACSWAFREAALHRVEAGTLVDNVASQHVLLRNGFERIGVSRRHVQIAGEWRDHVLFSRLADDAPGASLE